MKMTNDYIYQIANELLAVFDKSDLRMPARVNFCIQKNIETIVRAAQEIEKARLEVAQYYGELSEETNTYVVSADKMEIANKELIDLFSLEQEISIRTFSIENLNNVELTTQQMRAIMFMIED